MNISEIQRIKDEIVYTQSQIERTNRDLSHTLRKLYEMEDVALNEQIIEHMSKLMCAYTKKLGILKRRQDFIEAKNKEDNRNDKV